MTEQWIRSERPDGHRSLWFKAALWITITADVRAPCVYIDNNRNTRKVCCAGKWIATEAANRGCPAPTAADLAWLRGEG